MTILGSTYDTAPSLMTRRSLLCRAAPALAMIPIGLALDGCGALTTDVALAPQIAQYAGIIAEFVQVSLPTIKLLTGLSGGAYNTISYVAGKIGDTAKAITTATVQDGVTLVADLGKGIGSIAGMLSGVPALPGFISTGIADAMALVSEAEKMVGIGPTPAPAAWRFAARAVGPNEAYASLKLIVAGVREQR